MDGNVPQDIYRIQRTLEKIIILSRLYLMANCLEVIGAVMADGLLLHFIVCAMSPAYSISVWLMQPHNTEQYLAFLRFLERTKMYICCFCYRPDIVTDQMTFWSSPASASHEYQAVPTKSSGSSLHVAIQFAEDTPIPNTRRRGITGTAPTVMTGYAPFSMDHPPSKIPEHNGQLLTAPRIQSHILQESSSITIRNSISRRSSSLPALSEDAPVVVPINEFCYQNSVGSEKELSEEFNFGVYFEYWRDDRKNSVIPKFKDLREELTQNAHFPMEEETYENLRANCQALLDKFGHKWRAKNIGKANNHCNIMVGSRMKLEHVIAIKVSTDFTKIPREFKRHCRKYYKNDIMESVKKRNREIAHWCRYLKESVMFYGQTMGPNEYVYSGMDARLVLDSMYQRFECPLSTSDTHSIANRFAEDGVGMILQLARANSKTRYLNVEIFSNHGRERERLFMGSTLKIVNIRIGEHSMKRYVSALLMMQQLISGHFIDGDADTRKRLQTYLEPTYLHSEGERLQRTCREEFNRRINNSKDESLQSLLQYIDEEAYDSETIREDMDDEVSMSGSNVTRIVGAHKSSLLQEEMKTARGLYCEFAKNPDLLQLLTYLASTHMNHLNIDM